ncbi:hypothetical protein NDN16_05180 [Aureimonas altamirensis]|uniref:hypothetical protein n=1 Tax=Aureimonas altamirensis TaxID=370622 RepID=UPI002036901C|nr:hypothetical protein [Aureimonas altamirensis]MCM2503069.1 hypothetical protein [Aureimonas altamirensis]
MSQGDIGILNPAQTSGTELADRLVSSHDAFKSMHSGNARPTYAVAGTLWLNTATSPWRIMMFTGATDAEIITVAPATGEALLDKARVGLENVNNTSDANKPVSTATQTALNAKVNTTDFNNQMTGKVTALNGVVSLRQEAIGGQWAQLQMVMTDGSLRKAVTDLSSNSYMAMYWNGISPVIKVDVTDFAVATRTYAEQMRNEAQGHANNINNHDVRELRWVHAGTIGYAVGGWNGTSPARPIWSQFMGYTGNGNLVPMQSHISQLQAYSWDRGWFGAEQ